ncbi:MAG: toxin-antitoxin system YwqK family antitoxin, partial [Bacteroidota bacterium]
DFRDYYPNGALRSEGRYRDGFEDSLWHYYYETGAIQERTNYRRGKLHGQVLRYHPNGQLMVEGYFIRDQQDSIQRTFSDKGVKLEEGHFVKGRKAGRWLTFFPGGDTARIELYTDTLMLLMLHAGSDGKRTVMGGNGFVSDRFENGNLRERTNYSGGLPDGEYTELY